MEWCLKRHHHHLALKPSDFYERRFFVQTRVFRLISFLFSHHITSTRAINKSNVLHGVEAGIRYQATVS
eukprot:scaffold3027_cov92-Skeletonema_dohrnii-CCMP3373.AAC.3